MSNLMHVNTEIADDGTATHVITYAAPGTEPACHVQIVTKSLDDDAFTQMSALVDTLFTPFAAALVALATVKHLFDENGDVLSPEIRSAMVTDLRAQMEGLFHDEAVIEEMLGALS